MATDSNSLMSSGQSAANAPDVWALLGSDERRKECLTDLLAALEDAREIIRLVPGPLPAEMRPMYRRILRTIAKARGQ